MNQQLRILLIEDDSDDVFLMEDIADLCRQRRLLNLELTAFHSLEAAFSNFQEDDYDIILLDLNLGSSIGIETLKIVTEQVQYLPIIVLTGLAEETLGLECIRHGASDFLVKSQVLSEKYGASVLCRAIQYARERNALQQKSIRQNEALERSYQELEQLIFAVSHDLKEPLQGINRFSQLLKNHYEYTLDTMGHQMLDYILREASRQHKQLEGLLKYLEVGTEERPITDLNVNAVINDAVFSLSEMEFENAVFELHYVNIPDTIRYNEHDLKTLFRELISNAIKFRKIGQKAVITVVAKECLNEWRFEVKDNGEGFDMNFQEKIFKVFQKLHNKYLYVGAGIGLPICKKIVEYYGGKISVHSLENEGTTFIFSIPKTIHQRSRTYIEAFNR